jgi:hypothetical protein
MSDKFFDELREKYPKMYDESYDLYVGPGWHKLIEELSHLIQSRINWSIKTSNPIPQVKMRQIKEKFGGLRIYYDGGDDAIGGMVDMAEAIAEFTCEECGKPGRYRDGGWIKTLCDEHDYLRKLKQDVRV